MIGKNKSQSSSSKTGKNREFLGFFFNFLISFIIFGLFFIYIFGFVLFYY